MVTLLAVTHRFQRDASMRRSGRAVTLGARQTTVRRVRERNGIRTGRRLGENTSDESRSRERLDREYERRDVGDERET